MTEETHRILIVGRSQGVLVDSVRMLRDRGYAANASNQFDTLLDDYDLREVDLVIFGGMVPPTTKDHLATRIRQINSQAHFLQGLAGIAPLLVAQVEEHFSGAVSGVTYDPNARSFRLALADAASVTLHGLWATFVPPDPVAQTAVAYDGELAAGTHEIAVPEDVPRQGSFAAMRIGGRTSTFQLGEMPQSVTRAAATGSLPPPEPLTTRFPWE
ncbi:hypothetical protein [Aeromicrobium phragmitis]|nr:hypothetical protein [Aeromicrobium phragmitis]